ncbi:MAG: PKD domain-containing protein [Dehalococcoidales bacterium]|nr:PKD domain-containing protein [Dehalococcoidales bacterium]
MEQLSASYSGLGSITLDSLSASGGFSAYFGAHIEVSANIDLSLKGLHVSFTGLTLSIGSMSLKGGGRVYYGDHLAVVASGKTQITSLYVKGGEASLGIGSLSADSGLSLYIGSYTQVDAALNLHISGLFASYAGFSGGLSSLSASGKAHVYLSDVVQVSASASLTLSSLHVSGGGINAKVESFSASAEGYLYIGENTEFDASGSLMLQNLYFSGFGVKLDIDSAHGSGKIELTYSTTSLSVNAAASANINGFNLETAGTKVGFNKLSITGGAFVVTSTEELSITGRGYLSLNGLTVKLTLETGSSVQATVEALSLKGSATLSIGDTLQAQTTVSLSIENAVVPGIIAVSQLSIDGAGSFSLDKQGVFAVKGKVNWEVSSDIVISHGNVDLDATGHLSLSDKLHFDLTVGSAGGHATIYLQIPGVATFDLENLVAPAAGTLTFEFTGSTANGEVYLDNSLDATWSYLAVSGSGAGGVINVFNGDVSASWQIQGNTATLHLLSNKGFSTSGEILGMISAGTTLDAGANVDLSAELVYTGQIPPDYVELSLSTSGGFSGTVGVETLHFTASIDSAHLYFKYDKNNPLDTVISAGARDLSVEVSWGGVQLWPPSWLNGDETVTLKAMGPDDTFWKTDSVSTNPGDLVQFKAEVLTGFNGNNNQDNNNQNNNQNNQVTSLSGGGDGRYIYEFIWGDGTNMFTDTSDDTSYFSSHTYDVEGTYIAKVNVYDTENNDELIGSSTVQVNVGGSPTPPHLNITLSTEKTFYYVGENIEFTAKISDDDNNDNPTVNALDGNSRYTYKFSFGDGTTFSDDSNSDSYKTTHSYDDWGMVYPTVTVTDHQTGLQGSATITIIIYRSPSDKLDVTLSANPLSPRTNEQVSFTVAFSENNNANNEQNGNNGAVNSLVDDGRYYIKLDFGEGNYSETYTDANTETFTHSYSSSGSYTVRAYVYDQDTGKSGDAIFTIYISGESQGCIEIEPNHINLGTSIEPGSTLTGEFLLENVGDTPVNWSVAEVPPKGDWSITPNNGEHLMPKSSVTIHFTVKAPQESNSDLNGYIKIWNRDNHEDFDIITILGSTPYTPGFYSPAVIFDKTSYVADENNVYRVTFDMSGCYDPDGGSIQKIRWDCNHDGVWDSPKQLFDLNGWWAAFDSNKQFTYDFSDEIPNDGNNGGDGQVTGLQSSGEEQQDSTKIIFVKVEIKDDDGQISSATAQVTIKYQNNENQPPVAVAGGPYYGDEDDGASVTFDASGSYDLDGSVVGYRWDFDGDGEWDTGWLSSATYTKSYSQYLSSVTSLSSEEYDDGGYHGLRLIVYRFLVKLFDLTQNEGFAKLIQTLAVDSGASQLTRTFTVRLEVKDDDGATDVDTAQVTIYLHQNQKPVAAISGPSSGKVGQSLTFSASNSYDPDGSIAGYRWDFNGDGSWDTGWLTYASKTHSYSSTGTYTVVVEVKDNDGATDTSAKTVKITSSQNQNPVAVVTGPTSGTKGNTYTFYGSNSYDQDGYIAYHAWIIYKEGTCFLAGTKVLMADETYRNIEEIKVGDMVKSYDENTGKTVNARVTMTFHHSKEEMAPYYLVINNLLRVTPEHLIYVNGNWTKADDIKVGDILQTFDGEQVTVYSIYKVYQRLKTFNLEVEKYHTFYANDILVHNSKSGSNSSPVWHTGAPSSKSYTFSSTGAYSVKLYVKDNNGATDTDTLQITITDGNNS